MANDTCYSGQDGNDTESMNFHEGLSSYFMNILMWPKKEEMKAFLLFTFYTGEGDY